MKNRRNVSNKTVAILLALVLAIGCAVGGTLAWLISQTDPVVNTFTYGDIDIDLTETTGTEYKIIPGVNINKNPKVTVKANSEACWLFVKVEEKNWPDLKETDGTTRKVNYAIADGWIALDSQTGVYYRKVEATAAKEGVSYYILKGDTTYTNGVVTVSEDLTKTEVDRLKGKKPTLTFTAYAVQKDGIDTAAAAWEKISNT